MLTSSFNTRGCFQEHPLYLTTARCNWHSMQLSGEAAPEPGRAPATATTAWTAEALPGAVAKPARRSSIFSFSGQTTKAESARLVNARECQSSNPYTLSKMQRMPSTDTARYIGAANPGKHRHQLPKGPQCSALVNAARQCS